MWKFILISAMALEEHRNCGRDRVTRETRREEDEEEGEKTDGRGVEKEGSERRWGGRTRGFG